MQALTDTQARIIGFIEGFIESNGYATTLSEIGDHFGISAQGANKHLVALKAKGAVDWADGKTRTLRIL